MSSLIYLIEGGKPLQLVQQHIAELLRVRAQNRVIADELGVREAVTCCFTGVLMGVVFPSGNAPQGWTKPDKKGVSYPKKGSPMAARFAAQVGYTSPVEAISDGLGVPCSISYEIDGGRGSTLIGGIPMPCGWLYCSESGPFAMFTPDVLGEVHDLVADGKRVTSPAATYTGVIDGCRQIDEEEWELIVAQHKLDMKRNKAEAEEPEGGAV